MRPWPRNYEELIKTVTNPPPVGSKIDRYILDLGRMSFVGQQIHQQTAFVSSVTTNFATPCVTKHLIASGQESGFKAGLWDRHHGVQVCEFGSHTDVINAVAVNPIDESVAITVSSDMQVRLWKSKSVQ